MADFDIKLNGAALESALQEAFTDANLNFGRRAAQEMTDDKWQWPRSTVRQTGITVDSPRDIRDLSGLIGSYTPNQVSPTVYDHAWTVDYAMAVHEGAVRNGADMPARPWTKEPVEKLPEDFEKLAKAKLGRVQ